jgi:hypothetical protein
MNITQLKQDPVLGRLAIALIVVAAGTLSAVLYHFVLMRMLLHYDYPYNTFLFIPKDRFADFYNQFKLSANRDPFVTDGETVAWERAYFPFTYLLMWSLSPLHRKLSHIIISIAFIYSFIGMMHWYCTKESKYPVHPENVATMKNLITAVVLLSYPMIFLLDRGNLEMLAAIPTILAVFLIGRDNDAQGRFPTSGVLLGIATALKLFPAVFSLLLLKKRRYWEFVLVFVLAIALNIISVCLFRSPIELTLKGVFAGERYWLDTYVLSSSAVMGSGMAYSSGFFNLIKCFLINHDLSVVTRFYSIAAVLLMCFVAWLVVSGRTTYLLAVYLLTCAMIILPHMSGDYRLIYVFIPLMYLVTFEKRYGQVEWAMFVAILFVLVPKHYYFFHENASISVLLNPLVIFASMMVVSVSCIKEADHVAMPMAHSERSS